MSEQFPVVDAMMEKQLQRMEFLEDEIDATPLNDPSREQWRKLLTTELEKVRDTIEELAQAFNYTRKHTNTPTAQCITSSNHSPRSRKH
jgi:hypothetical protein